MTLKSTEKSAFLFLIRNLMLLLSLNFRHLAIYHEKLSLPNYLKSVLRGTFSFFVMVDLTLFLTLSRSCK